MGVTAAHTPHIKLTYTRKFNIDFDPIADHDAVVAGPNVRFTLLTSRLVRMEHSPTGEFEDRPSQAFWRRRQPVPRFQASRTGGVIRIETDHLVLRYRVNPGGFTPDSLEVRLKAGGEWRFGRRDPENLGGTVRTLDMVDGATALEPGLASRSGWAVVDDSAGLVFDDDGWLAPRESAGNTDLYFFGYGSDYAGCQLDFYKVAGPAPMLPRWALGNWWSRYARYSAGELTGLMREFRDRSVPLSVCIVDMDWHLTETGNSSSGWTGYTWNRDLFPDPRRFIDELHRMGLKVTLNLHPALGVHPHEEQYAAMAEAVGIDPDGQKPVPFDIASPRFVQAYFELLHHPIERQGVDFWWVDWQQGTDSAVAGLDPLWWLNHLHFYDLARKGERPLLLSRWGGLGSHRYPVGFSGDTIVSWESLAFQPYFTATAANVGYGWWSHDIGGHTSGVEDAELYVRWVQYGVFSPILRLHSTLNPFHERRPWAYDAETLRVSRDAMQLRHALIPYVYTMARRSHTEGVALVRPMYYEHPGSEEAYGCGGQYYFGSELIAAPFVSPADEHTRLSRQAVWLPPGDWFGFLGGERYEGGGWYAIHGGLDEVPVFARAGAIVPLGPRAGWGGVDNPESLEVHVFPGADNSFELYEDDGGHEHSLITFSQKWDSRRLEFEIQAARGATAHLPRQRAYTLLFRCIGEAPAVSVELNREPVSADVRFEDETMIVSGIVLAPTDMLAVTLVANENGLLGDADRRAAGFHKLLKAFKLSTRVKWELDLRTGKIIADPGILAEHGSALAPSQARALRETITGLYREWPGPAEFGGRKPQEESHDQDI